MAGRDAPRADMKLRVRARERVAADVLQLTLAHPDGTPLPAWEPGAHIDLVLDEATTRQYSLCGNPADRSVYRVAVLREPVGRGGSVRVHDELTVGGLVEVRGPRNLFPLGDASRYLFIAGGIGITPILPMIRRAEAAGADWALLYGGRSLSSMAFHAELSAEYGSRVHVHPQDTEGLLDLDTALGCPREDTLVYCCGPEPLLTAVEQRCAAWPPGALRVERFSARPADESADTAFDVVLARTGLTVHVPAGRSIVDALADAAVDVPTSCREGTCGTCEVQVLDGIPDHRDAVLLEEERAENTVMMPCVSRCRSAGLVLDL